MSISGFDKVATAEEVTSCGLSASTTTVSEKSATTSLTSSSMNKPRCENEVPVAVNVVQTNSDAEEDTDDESEVLEESPCGRWLKRREVIKYCDVPGIDTAYLAMDGEVGVEVVWNEATFSESKKLRTLSEDKLKNVFDALTAIEHPNIVKFHKYWTTTGVSAPIANSKALTAAERAAKVVANAVAQAAGVMEATATPVVSEAIPVVAKTGGGHKTGEKTRLIFITEYMTSGSLKLFLRRQKKNGRKVNITSWKRWCMQILSALNYLHEGFSPPIIHGNLTCDTIFIQHNGLVKIGSVAPDIIYTNVKTCRENIKNLHFLAPEWGGGGVVTPTPAVDIYAFGMCALETAVLEIQSRPNTTHNTDNVPPVSTSATTGATNTGHGVQLLEASAGSSASTFVSEDSIQRSVESLEDSGQRDFIKMCLSKNPEDRPTARSLLLHPVLFEVHSLKLLAAHMLIHQSSGSINETVTDETIESYYGSETVLVSMRKKGSATEMADYKLSDFPVSEKLEKFMEDVKFGIYPLTAFALAQPPLTVYQSNPRSNTPDAPVVSENVSSQMDQTTTLPVEVRRIKLMECLVKLSEENEEPVSEESVSGPAQPTYDLFLNLKLDDSVTRNLNSQLSEYERCRENAGGILSDELVSYAFINPADRIDVSNLVQHALDSVGQLAVCQLCKSYEPISEPTEPPDSVLTPAINGQIVV